MKKVFKNINKYHKFTIDDFSKFGWNKSIKTGFGESSSYNVNSENKGIKNGLGISALKMPKFETDYTNLLEVNTENLEVDCINNVIYMNQYFTDEDVYRHRLFIHCSDNKLYINQMFTNIPNFHWLYELEFDTPPICLSYKYLGYDRYLLSSKEKMVVSSPELGMYTIENLPIITSMCNYNNILFCSIADDLYTVWWAYESNPELIGTESDYAGTFNFDAEGGPIRKVLNFNGNVYVFRDYGISRIYYYSKYNKKFTHIYTSVSKIRTDTVLSCGDEILFMTADGLYTFDGVNVNKKTLGIEKYIDSNNKNIVAEILQNKYYIALRMNFQDDQKVLCEEEDYVNNALLVVDLNDYEVEVLRGVDIKSMCALRANGVEKMLFTFNTGEVKKIGELDESGNYFDKKLPKFYTTNYIFQDDLEQIVVKKIRLISNENITVKIITEEKTCEFKTTKNGLNEFQTIIPCKNFKVEFSSNDEMKIDLFETEYFKKN